MTTRRHHRWFAALIAVGLVASASEIVSAQQEMPNIVVIWGDDIGVSNISAYHRGMMGGSTPNIDRLAKEGIMFTDYYAQQSCTAGRASFILGQNPFRTGLLTIGMPGSEQGVQAKDPTIAELLKPMGYATAQIGKNHLGDRNEFLPTVHGFDQFYGNLYHLNAEEEPEDPDYPKDPEFLATFGPRGLLDCVASDVDDPTVDPRRGPCRQTENQRYRPPDSQTHGNGRRRPAQAITLVHRQIARRQKTVLPVAQLDAESRLDPPE